MRGIILIVFFYCFFIGVGCPGHPPDRKSTKGGRVFTKRSELYLTPNNKWTIYVFYSTFQGRGRGRATAEKFGISTSTVHRIKKEFEQQGEFIFRSLGAPIRDTPRKNQFVYDTIIALLDRRPDLYLSDISRALTDAFGVYFSPTTVRNRLLELGYSRKRFDRRDSRAQTDAIQTQRLEWRMLHMDVDIDIDRFAFINETTVRSSDWARTHGYTSKGDRAYAPNLFVSTTNNNVVAAHNSRGTIHVRIQQSGMGSVTQPFFNAYLEELVTLVPRGTIFVLDNARCHHDDDAIQRIMAENGMYALFLPPYSPDYNPIEYIFGYLKASLKDMGVRVPLTGFQMRQQIENILFNSIPAHIFEAFVGHCHGLWTRLYDRDFPPPDGGDGAGGGGMVM